MDKNNTYKGGQKSILDKGDLEQTADVLSKGAKFAKMAGNVAGYAGLGMNFVQPVMGLASDYNAVKNMDLDERLPEQAYNPYVKPEHYEKEELPEELTDKAQAMSFLNNAPGAAMAGFKLGNKIAPGIGGLIGGGLGLIGAGVMTAKTADLANSKRIAFLAKQEQRYDDYKQANQRYYDKLGTQTRSRQQAQSYAKRGQNVIPYYNASIYGYV